MKETQKLDLILKAIYEFPGKTGDLTTILAGKDSTINRDELDRLVKYLTERGFIESDSTRAHIHVAMKTEGMQFVEGDSFEKKGEPVVNHHYNISHSTNANIVSGSSGTTITQNYNSEPKQLLDQIRKAIADDNQVSEQQRQDIIDSVEDVQAGLDSGRIPKVSLKQLLEVGAKISSVSSFALKLAEVLGYLPN